MSRNKKAYRKIREVLKGIISNMGSVILILALCTIVIAIIINWKSVVIEMQRFIKVIMPFIFGLVLAFLINPLVESIQKILNRLFFRTKHKRHASIQVLQFRMQFYLDCWRLRLFILYRRFQRVWKNLQSHLEMVTITLFIIQENCRKNIRFCQWRILRNWLDRKSVV